MSGLWVVLGTVVGGGIGFGGGMLAALLWADMDLGNLDAFTYPMVGTVGGAVIGAFITGQLIT